MEVYFNLFLSDSAFIIWAGFATSDLTYNI